MPKSKRKGKTKKAKRRVANRRARYIGVSKKSRPKAKKTPLYQTGTVKNLQSDAGQKAMKPGIRISASGKRYSERRKNRSDRAPESGL